MRKVLLFLIVSICLSSCKKDKEFEQKHKQLLRITHWDDKKVVGTTEFTYNDQGKLIHSIFLSNDKDFSNTSTSEYKYDGKGNIIEIEDKIIRGRNQFLNQYIINMQLFYNEDNTIKSTNEMVWYNGSLSESNEYTYIMKDGKVSEINKKFNLLSVAYQSIKFTYKGNNISKIENWPYTGNIKEYEYGIAKSPYLYSRISNYPIMKMFLEPTASYYSENELITERQFSRTGLDEIINYQYVYDKANYPNGIKKDIKHYSSGDVIHTAKEEHKYEYK